MCHNNLNKHIHIHKLDTHLNVPPSKKTEFNDVYSLQYKQGLYNPVK